jgi:diguanylate cyclase (GGDEF)-like protein
LKFRRSPDQQIRLLYLPAILGVLIMVSLVSDLSTFRKAALVVVLFLTAALHSDLRDGGLLSRWIYARGFSYHFRNYFTVSAGFFAATLILAIANAFYTPLIMIYYIPIVLSAMRGGHRMTVFFGSLLAVAMFAYFQIGRYLSGEPYGEGTLYILLFLGLSLASGQIGDRLRRSAVDLSALYETGRALNSTLNVKEIYALIMNIVSMDLAPDVSALFMVDSEKRLKLEAHRGLDDEKVADLVVISERGLIGQVAKTQTPMSVSQANRRWQLSFAPEINSAMAVPLRIGEKMIGVLMVGKRMPYVYGYDNLRFIEALAGQAAISIQNAELYRKTREWASTDGMTGIYNYRYFAERLDSEWNRAVRYEKPLSLIMIDVDLFKSVNDNYGHLCGDAVLREIAKHLKLQTRETDVTARYGGEEFVVILPETHYKDAVAVAEKLRESVYDATFAGGSATEKIKLTISLGVANYPTTACNKSDLIYQADQALYQAKIRRNALATPLDIDPVQPAAVDAPNSTS